MRLLKTIGRVDFTGQERAALNKLTMPSGTRSWVQRLVIRGRRRELGLGGFPLVPLKDARA